MSYISSDGEGAMDQQEVARRALDALTLRGKVAMVTGAGSGIGRGIALCLASFGASVAALDIRAEAAAETVQMIQADGGEAQALLCDVTSMQSAQSSALQVANDYGSIDILCNNAGSIIRKSVVETEEEEWDNCIDVTLKGAYTLSRATIPYMVTQGGGAIVNTGSGWSMKGGAQAAAYCAAKAGVLNLTRAMAIDHGAQGIRVNCVCPGDVLTPMLMSECKQLGENADHFLREAARRPIARIGTAQDVAQAVLFLVSPMSAWISGASLVVDGGGLA